MFYLGCSEFPSSCHDLIAALARTLGQLFHLPPGHAAVVTEGGEYPTISRLTLNLTGATVNADYRAPKPVGVGRRQPGPVAKLFAVEGHPIRYAGASLDLDLRANQVRFEFDRDAQGNPLLLLADVGSGQVTAQIGRCDIESLVLAMVQAPAAEHGVTVASIRLDFTQIDSRSVGMTAKVTARKKLVIKMVTAAIDIRGRLSVDDQLYASISGLSCEGDGVVGSLLCKLIRPKLERFNGQGVSLIAFPLGGATLRDVAISVGSSLKVAATFAGNA